MRPALVLSAFAFAAALSCKKKEAAALSPQDTCAKVESLQGKMTDEERTRCVRHIEARPPAVRTCIGTCAANAKGAFDYLDCKDDCTGDTILVASTCDRLGRAEGDATECVGRYFRLEKSSPDIYKCLSRCVRRAGDDKAAAAACRTTCKVPPSTPR